ncbi:MAG: ADP-ribosylglycohydrolase family protein [Chloroflexi bacterium]|nr:ADP-ribosylglycohydrolase family protein [Chloroflexota bacterium]MCY3588718.1 ADP-ribosylglycohydrolase family protein [Chloroflexota bacterium]MCY3684759.1 ADP-ribosylglycohydrolase family protein [Chloroflexota bacterium]MDE2709804.1 ADP-ribosylglycohydrolase family protein [Chloroflexota bacterium]
MSTLDDPGIVRRAPHLAELIGAQPAAPLDQDRARGVLLGLAVGNLLGLPVEGASRSTIQRSYPAGLREIDPRERYRPMDDDLAQAVDLAEALARDPDPVLGFADRLVKWRTENGRGIGIMTSTVIDYLEVGLGVLGAANAFWQERGSPETQPNGALMRCAPVALRHALEPQALITQSALTCAVTHFAPGAQWSCILVNAAIAMLVRGHEPNRDDLIVAATQDGAPAELIAWTLAIPDAIDDRIAEERVSGHTYLCMQAALWSLDTRDGLEHALVRIVNAGGDTDTNAAVAGAVLGARFGASAIPQRWLECIPDPERIESATQALLKGP